MTRLRIRRRLATAAGLLAVLLPVTAGGRAAAQPTPEPVLPLTVTVTTLTPTAPQPGDLLTVGGTVTNPTGQQYDGVKVALRYAPDPLLSRSQLLAVAGSTAHFDSDDATDPVALGSLPAGSSAAYHIEVPVDALGLQTAGVYRLSVEVYTGSDTDRAYQARANTFLPWLPPDAGVPKVQVAWLWPLLTTPRLEPDGTFHDDGLGAEIAPRGRLGALLDVAARAATQSGEVSDPRAPLPPGTKRRESKPTRVPNLPVHVTPVVDPETVQELQLMADTAVPYQVDNATGGGTTKGGYAAAAGAYLAALRSLMGKDPTIATPYADPDIEALTRAGASSLVTQARSTGIESTLPGVVSGLVWPPGGALSGSSFGQLTTSGLILASSALPLSPAAALTYTPTDVTAVQRASGTVPAVVIDSGLSALAQKRISAQDKVLINQRYAAETAAIAVESAPSARTFVIAPGRRWSPTNSDVRALVDLTGRLPWVAPVTVPDALVAPADPQVSRGPLTLPPGPSAVSPSLAGQVAAANAELADFRSILCPAGVPGSPASSPTIGTSPAVTSPAVTSAAGTAATPSGAAAAGCNRDTEVLGLQRSLYRAASTAFADTGGGADLLSRTTADLRRSAAQVHIATKGTVTLVGNRAQVPITVTNDLPVAVKVKLVLRSPSAQLRTTEAPQTLVIAARSTVQRFVTVRTVRAGAGTLPVDAQLLTPNGHDFGAPATLQVRVSAYGAVVVFLTVAVCGLLALAVVVRLVRRVRAHRRRPDDAVTGAAG